MFFRYKEKFLKREIDDIPLVHLGENSRLRVLPNLTEGKLLSISRHISKCEWIETKEDMELYWKNTYGYQLPDGFGDIYLNIRFSTNPLNPSAFEVFCYPIEVRSLWGNFKDLLLFKKIT